MSSTTRCRKSRASTAAINSRLIRTRVDRLPQQVRQRELCVLTLTAIYQVPIDQFAKAQLLIQLAHQNQAAVRGDPLSLEINLQRGVEGELKRPVLFLTHWVLTSIAASWLPNPYE